MDSEKKYAQMFKVRPFSEDTLAEFHKDKVVFQEIEEKEMNLREEREDYLRSNSYDNDTDMEREVIAVSS